MLLLFVKVLSYQKTSFTVGLWDLPHRFTLPDPQISIILEVIVEKVQEDDVFLELMQLVNAESVHIVIDLDDLFTFYTPSALYLLP